MSASESPSLSFPATFEAYGRAAAELRRMLEERGVKPRPRHHAELIFEEIVSNIIRHGCTDNPQCVVEVKVALHDNSIVLDFEDNARPFDPRAHDVPALPDSLEEASPGGLGLRLVRKASKRIDYERTAENRNHLTVTIAQ
jgi:anti-sigma regulatory factor (Ser/Thr protein kinase)